MKIKTVFISVISTLLIGCATMLYGIKYEYSYKLNKPDANDMKWEDDKLAISFLISDKAINFSIKNKTSEVMKILWDDATVVQFGKAQKVMHSGTKYIDRNNSQPPSAIPPQAAIDDMVLPTDNVDFISGQYGGWQESDLFQTRDMNKEEYRKSILGSKGQKFSLYLPIQYQGKTLDYNYEFEITDVQQQKK